MRIRYEFLKQKVDGLIHFDTPSPFIAFLTKQEGRVDTLFLDHDLGDGIPKERVERFVGAYSSRDTTGADVCYALQHMSLAFPIILHTQIIIHSLNKSGAKNMESILKSAGFTNVQVTEIDELYETINPDRLLESVCDACYERSGTFDRSPKTIRHKMCSGQCAACGELLIPGNQITLCSKCI